MSKPVIFNNTVLRDGHQSLAATRMRTEQMLPALEVLDGLGFGCLETWGGATIDAGLRFLKEFPFDRLDAIRSRTKSKHMMLLRGQNIVQYAHFPDDIVETFIKTSAKHGMDIFRIFDALNDPRNMGTAIKAAKAAGKEAQGVICYTTSPVHNTEAFVKLGQELEEAGCASLCLKDMAGLVPPQQAYDIIKGLKDRVKIPVVLHTHDTAGLGATTYYAGVEAGVDYIDTSIIPFANGTGQPDTARMLSLLENHPRCPKYDLDALQFLREHFTKVYEELKDFTSFSNERVDSDALKYQVPGGMLSNFRNQLKEQKMEDKFEDVFKEIPVVRKALGWIPLVTPTSQIVGVQAMLNVKFGRWKNFSPQATDIALGYYGRTPAPVDPEVQKIAAQKSGKDPITVRPADLKDPGMDALRKALAAKNLPTDDEHCVIQAMFPQELDAYYKSKDKPTATAASQAAAASPAAPAPQKRETIELSASARRYNIAVEGKQYSVAVEEM
ncbi:pyruvate carboxylase subunit B [Pelagicoccus enzymogenes]|uniref:pyruvate carboxylase subunit B n=1 Tax=Pelagicoccus enzymogenes TaxID=2773457 RepID=UPI00280F9415|nr:pyruvate carboxylase subunit B [Pelagicoccus enzymogenes]MDQ8198787.1 pyruvate carboxylase subunit B [Pelagicoccus enzymogenes]